MRENPQHHFFEFPKAPNEAKESCGSSKKQRQTEQRLETKNKEKKGLKITGAKAAAGFGFLWDFVTYPHRCRREFDFPQKEAF